jgi:hypothetical protein
MMFRTRNIPTHIIWRKIARRLTEGFSVVAPRRLALEHPERVTRGAVIDIVPEPYSSVNRDFTTAYFRWLFLNTSAVLRPRRYTRSAPMRLAGSW